MKKKIKGLHLEVTDGLKNAIDTQIYHLKEKLDLNNEFEISVDLSIEKLLHVCHIKVIDGRKIYIVTKKDTDMYKSILDAFSTINKKIVKERDKKITLKREQSIKSIIKNEIIEENEKLENEELCD